MTTSQVRCQLRAEEMGVAAREKDLAARALQTIDEQFPLRQILNFIEEYPGATPIQTIQRSHQLVQICDPAKTLVIEICVAPRPGVSQNLAHRVTRLARPPGPHHHAQPATGQRLHNRTARNKNRFPRCIEFPTLGHKDVMKIHR